MTLSPISLLAYAAGYFDGEGCVCITGPAYNLTAKIVSADKESLEVFDGLFGGGLKRVFIPGGKREFWAWRAYSRASQKALVAMLPFLRAKRRHAELALELSYISMGKRLTSQEWATRIRVKTAMQLISRRGRAA